MTNGPADRRYHGELTDPFDFGIGHLFYEIGDAVIVGDVETECIVLWNPAAEALFGYSETEARGRPLHSLVPERLRDAHLTGIARYRDSGVGRIVGGGSPTQLRGLHKNGHEVDVELTLTRLPDLPEDGRYVLAIVRDTGERMDAQRRLEQEHQRLQGVMEEQARLTQRLGDLDDLRNEFIAMVVHDLQSPITAINGLGKIVKERWPELGPERMEKMMESIVDSASRLSQMVQEMLRVAELESRGFTYDLRPVDIAALVREVAEDYRAISTHVEVEVDAPHDLPPALADDRRQRQIMSNLVSNAVKFSPVGGRVRIAVERVEDELHVSVSDEGPGLSEQQQAKLFQRFARVGATSGVGTGLGLFISKEMVDGQNGRIWVTSTPGAGATFSYSIPLAR